MGEISYATLEISINSLEYFRVGTVGSLLDRSFRQGAKYRTLSPRVLPQDLSGCLWKSHETDHICNMNNVYSV